MLNDCPPPGFDTENVMVCGLIPPELALANSVVTLSSTTLLAVVRPVNVAGKLFCTNVTLAAPPVDV